MNIRVAVYLRISLDATGEGLAVDRQKEDCLRIAKLHGWDITEVYTDNSISASNRRVKRPAYDRMKDDYEAGKFDNLICWDLDRLTRQPRQLEDWVDLAEERGLRIVTANGEADLSTDGGRTYARIKAAIGKGEMERKSARQKRANLQRAEMGKTPTSNRLTGYEKSGEINEAEAEIIRALFSKFAGGESLKGLVDWLNESEIETRNGGVWARKTIRNILRNPRYVGRSVYLGQDTGVLGNWEPIISEGEFSLVQARLNDPARKTNRSGTHRKYLGSGLFLCGVCGGKLRTNGMNYWCPVGGHANRIRDAIDEFVTEFMVQRLSSPDVVEALNVSRSVPTAAIDQKISDVRTRKQAFEMDYDSGLIDGARFKSALDKAEMELTALENHRTEMLYGNTVAQLLENKDPAQAYLNASLGEQRNIIESLYTVTVERGTVGRGFNPDSVRIVRKIGEVNGTNPKTVFSNV